MVVPHIIITLQSTANRIFHSPLIKLQLELYAPINLDLQHPSPGKPYQERGWGDFFLEGGREFQPDFFFWSVEYARGFFS